jgi:hypothetical protein
MRKRGFARRAGARNRSAAQGGTTELIPPRTPVAPLEYPSRGYAVGANYQGRSVIARATVSAISRWPDWLGCTSQVACVGS